MSTLDVVTLADASEWLQRPADPSILVPLITSVSKLLDDRCGPIVARAVTETHYGGVPSIVLDSWPVYSVTSVTEYSGSTGTVLSASAPGARTAAGYIVDGGILRRTTGSGSALFCTDGGLKNVVIIMQAGRYASTATVDARFKEAALVILAHLWRAEQGTGNTGYVSDDVAFGPSFAFPRRAMELLGDDLRPRSMGIA